MGGPAGLELELLKAKMMQRSANGLSSGWSYWPNWLLKSRNSLDPPFGFRREGRNAAIRRMGDERGSGFAIYDCYQLARIPIDLRVLLAAQSSLIAPCAGRPSARDGPRVRRAPF